tara:strand:- start:1245 stop:2150 length:906 start_codon:yes stop_codon:yes gene_type:complete
MAEGLTLSSSSSLSSMSLTVVADAIANVEPAGPTAGLVTRYDLAQGQTQKSIPLWGRLTAAALTEGVEINAAQQLSVTVRNVTASEHGILTFVSRVLQRENSEDVLAEVGMMQGLSLGRLRESDLVTQFDSVTGLSIPGTGQNLGFRQLAGAVAYMQTDNNSSFGPAPGGRVNAVLHPEQIRRLVEDDSGLQAGGSTTMDAGARPKGPSEQVIENYWRGREKRFGVQVWSSGVIARTASNSKGGIFAPQAFALCMAQEIEADDDKDIRSRGTDIVTVAVWGETEIVDEWAVEAFSLSSAIS